MVHVCFYSAPFGVVPLELDEVYPLSQHETALPLDCEVKDYVATQVAEYIKRSSYESVVLINDSNTWGNAVKQQCRTAAKKRGISFEHLTLKAQGTKEFLTRLRNNPQEKRRRSSLIFADLHNHTTFSPDSVTRPKDLVEALVAHPIVKVAAVTDHDSVKGLDTVRELAAPYPDILIIPGVEIATRQGDIVVLGVQELPPKPWDVEDIVDFAKATGCVTIAVHPFRAFGLGDEVADSEVDAIEVYNGASSLQANHKALVLAKKSGFARCCRQRLT